MVVLPTVWTVPATLFIDGHCFHISVELIDKLTADKVVLMCFPTNTTHLLQSLDFGTFTPLKNLRWAILKVFLSSRSLRSEEKRFPRPVKRFSC